jgi:hypothetical protein
MSEYSVAGPIFPNFDYVYKPQPEKTEPAHGRINSEGGVYKAIREYFEQFEAELDNSHEIAIRLASFGNEIDFRPEKIGFSMPSLITFIGVTDACERVQLVQHISQLSFLLRAVEKLNDQPTRIAFNA